MPELTKAVPQMRDRKNRRGGERRKMKRNNVFLGIWLFVLLGGILGTANAQWLRPKWFHDNAWTNSWVDDKFQDAAIPNDKLVNNELSQWFPVQADSGATIILRGTGGWQLDASNPPVVAVDLAGMTFGFDADGTGTDEYVTLTFPVPANYAVDSLSLRLYWYHMDDDGEATDVVKWQGTCQAVGAGEKLFLAGTALTAVTATCATSDSTLYITTLNPEVEVIAPYDLVTIKIGVDISESDLDSGELAYLLGVLVQRAMKND